MTTETVPAATASATYDPFDAAMNPDPISTAKTFFCEVMLVDPRFFRKGSGGQPWMPGDAIDQRMTKILIDMQPLRGQYPVKQDVYDFSKEWQKFTLPSLRAVNLTLRNLLGTFVQVQRVETGETYVNSNGDTKAKTALKFIAVYPDRAACEAAAEAFYVRPSDAAAAQPAAAPQDPPQPVVAPADDAARKQAAEFLPLLWQAAGQNVGAFLKMVTETPTTATYFNAQSPEIEIYTGGVPF